jgi:two-component system chemotaxis response regulator CheB
LEALELVETLRPDVVTSDLVMPELDGVRFVTEQMLRRPLPIVVMSSLDGSGAMALAALEAGAVDFIQKPTALASEKMLQVRSHLIETIKAAASVGPDKLAVRTAAKHQSETNVWTAAASGSARLDLIAIGISTGGPQALRFLIPQLPADFPVPIAIVMHMPVGYTELYAEKLNDISAVEVSEAREGDELRPGVALLAPAGKHLYFRRQANGDVAARLSLRPHDTPHRPSVDVMFEAAAETFGKRTLGIVMTGMGSDGTKGSAHIKGCGGTIFAESEESCIVFGMPRSVVEAGLADRTVRLDDMAQILLEAV